MAILGFLFLSWRIVEFFTLIPIIGMLAYFIHGFVASNNLTPTYILVLFIASVLGAAWTLFTTILYLRARHSAGFVALVDLGFVGAFIAGVVVLRGVTSANCSNFNSGDLFVSLGPFGYYGVQSGSSYAKDTNKNCSLLKASFAFGIMECIFFFITFLLALLVARHHRKDKDDVERVVVKRETHSSRHSQRRSSRDRRDRGGDRSYDRPSGSRRSHHSRRSYYV